LILAAGDSEIRPSSLEPAVTLASGSDPRLPPLQRLPTLTFCLMQQTPRCFQTRTHPQLLFFSFGLQPSALSLQQSAFSLQHS